MSAPFDSRQDPESRQLDDKYGTIPVELNHLELMGIQMSLHTEQSEASGLSSPQAYALQKIEIAFAKAMKNLRGEN